MLKSNLLIIVLAFVCLSCSSDESHSFEEDASFHGKIWESNKYCAFTDLVEYNNIYYCCFRESDGHLPSSVENYGKIRILSSSDGLKWQSAVLVEDSKYDLRDPKLEVTSDGRLMLLVGCSSFDNQGFFNFRKTKVAFSMSDLSELSNLQEIQLGKARQFNNLWLWRSIWHEGKAYGVAYLPNNKSVLLKSIDGVNYTEVTQFELPMTTNEAGIVFRSNGNMVTVIRDNNSNGYIGEAEPPYDKWLWKPLNIGVHCPKMIIVDDYIFLAIRNTSAGSVSLQYIRPEDDLNINNLYNIPIKGDMGYPGIVNDGSNILISYYSNGSIFLVKYPRKNIFNRIGIAE